MHLAADVAETPSDDLPKLVFDVPQVSLTLDAHVLHAAVTLLPVRRSASDVVSELPALDRDAVLDSVDPSVDVPDSHRPSPSTTPVDRN